MQTILNFLSQLKENNTRDWFQDNKPKYEEAKAGFESFVNILIPAIKEFDSSIDVNSAKECTFRIYKDVRFSKNKEPYKTNMGAYIAKGGKKSEYAGYYIHIEAGASFAGGGIYCPQPTILKSVRECIFQEADSFKAIINNKPFKSVFPELYGDKLKTAPRGFSKDFPDIDLLNYKSYTAVKHLSDSEIIKPNLLEALMVIFKTQKPFNDYLNKAIAHA